MSSSSLTIDVREACSSQRTGKGQWTRGLVTELLHRSIPVRLLSDAPLPAEWEKLQPEHLIIPKKGFAWHWHVANMLKKETQTMYVSPTSFIVPALLGSHVQCFPVVHDLIAFRSEPHQMKARVIEQLTLKRAVQFAKNIFTISDSTRNDLLKKYPHVSPDRITTIYAGPMDASLPLSTPDQRTILCIATLSPRKNQERLIRAYSLLPEQLRKQYQLLLVGSRGWQDSEIVRLAKETHGVVWKGYVSDAEYAELMRTCTVFALPSLYEGFGMQILDALERGIPVLTSDRGSLKEVVGSAALTVDPENVEAIAQGLQKLLTDHALREALQKAGPEQAKKFSWERTADLVLETISSKGPAFAFNY